MLDPRAARHASRDVAPDEEGYEERQEYTDEPGYRAARGTTPDAYSRKDRADYGSDYAAQERPAPRAASHPKTTLIQLVSLYALPLASLKLHLSAPLSWVICLLLPVLDLAGACPDTRYARCRRKSGIFLSELPRTHLLGISVNRGKKEAGALSRSSLADRSSLTLTTSVP